MDLWSVSSNRWPTRFQPTSAVDDNSHKLLVKVKGIFKISLKRSLFEHFFKRRYLPGAFTQEWKFKLDLLKQKTYKLGFAIMKSTILQNEGAYINSLNKTIIRTLFLVAMFLIVKR